MTGTQDRPRAGYFVALQQLVTLLVHFAQVFILSRILAATDYGVVAMAGSIFALAAVFKDFGFSTSTIQSEEIDPQDSTNLFWVGLFSSCLIVTVILVSSRLFSAWFREPIVAPLLCVFAVTFLIDSVGNQPTALAQRAFLFQRLAIWKISGLFVGLATGVGLALNGWGPWSIVSINCVEAVITTLGAFAITRFRPGWIADLKRTKEHLKFGGALTLGGLLSYAGGNIDRLIIGRFLGAESLGYYTRAHSLLILPMSKMLSGFKRFNIASLSRVASQPTEFRASVSKILIWYLMVCSIIVVPLSACSEDLIRFAMGDKWLPVAPLFAILAPYIWVHVTSMICYLAHISKGDIKGLTSYYAINFVLLTGCLAASVSFGLKWVVIVYCLVGLIGVQSTLVYFAWRRQFIDLKSFCRLYLVNAAISCATFAVLKGLQVWIFHSSAPWINLLLGVAVSIPMMIALYSLIPECRSVLATFRNALFSTATGILRRIPVSPRKVNHNR